MVVLCFGLGTMVVDRQVNSQMIGATQIQDVESQGR